MQNFSIPDIVNKDLGEISNIILTLSKINNFNNINYINNLKLFKNLNIDQIIISLNYLYNLYIINEEGNLTNFYLNILSNLTSISLIENKNY